MSKYKIRFFVDNDRSLILWSGNDETIKKYDYPIIINNLPISQELAKALDLFGDEITTKFGYIKSLESYPQLKDTKENLISRLRKELGDDYEIIDEMI